MTTETRILDGLREFDRWNQQAILAVFALFGIPGSYADFGCGTGAMVRAARGLGVDAIGVDLDPGPDMVTWDLRTHFDAGRTFDLVTSIETAEHIDPDAAGTFLDTLVRHTSERGIIVFTAAPPGQEGHGHVNCQSGQYWRSRFFDRGFDRDMAMTTALALVWGYSTGPMMHLPSNLQVMRRYR